MKSGSRILLAFVAILSCCSDGSPDTWLHEESGIEIPLPDGFSERTHNGLRLVGRWSQNASEPSPNINILVIPTVGPADLDALHRQNKEAFEAMPDVEVLLMEKTTISGHRVLHCEFRGRLPGLTRDLHFESVLFPVGGNRQVVITATCTEEQWDELGDQMTAALKGMTIPKER